LRKNFKHHLQVSETSATTLQLAGVCPQRSASSPDQTVWLQVERLEDRVDRPLAGGFIEMAFT
jgi:hypothetical protein